MGRTAFRSLPVDALVLWEFQENPKHPLHTGTVGRASWNDLEMTENLPTSEIILYQTDFAWRLDVVAVHDAVAAFHGKGPVAGEFVSQVSEIFCKYQLAPEVALKTGELEANSGKEGVVASMARAANRGERVTVQSLSGG